MRRVPVDFLQPGMKVGRPVYNSRGILLLAAGTVLSRRTILKLKSLGIPALYIDDGLLPDISVDDVISDDVRVQAIRRVRCLLEAGIEELPVGRAIIKVREMAQTVNEIIDQLLSQQSLAVNLVDIRSIDDYTFGHSVNVCVLALLTGITLGFNRARLFHLGMGALLHDIGKLKIPREILNKPDFLTGEEFEIVKRHTTCGYELLKRLPEVSETAARVAYEHHERHLGQGYPQGLRGEEIHAFARITAVADVFDALTADRVYRRGFPVHEAYEMIAGSGNFLFDFPVVQAFLYNIAAYPVGTIVALSNGEVGVVTETARGLSLYPRVRILFDGDGEPVADFRERALAQERTVTVIRVMDESELQRLEGLTREA
ncbi:MAG: HD domain-containing phosphohydrolase [Bacillota bacterium]